MAVYTEAPTFLRIDAVAWLPELFDALLARGREMREKAARATVELAVITEGVLAVRNVQEEVQERRD